MRLVCTVWVVLALLEVPPALASPPQAGCGTSADLGPALLALHRYWLQTGPVGAKSPTRPSAFEVDQVAVLVDRGDLVVRHNLLDLELASLRLAPNRARGYDVARLSLSPVDPAATWELGDEDSRALDLPFSFPFFDHSYLRIFVHADGNVTFGAPDESHGQPSLGRFLEGPPRLAAFFADLAPSRGGGVSAEITGDRVLIAWHEVPGTSQVNRNSFQLTLHAGGEIDLVYGILETRETIIGVSPGATSDLVAADLSEARPSGSSGALVERFSEAEKLDLATVTHRFYASYPDEFAQIIVYTTRPLNPLPGTLAFHIGVRNAVDGIGVDGFDDSAGWGSRGGLESVVFMGSIDTYLEIDGFEVLGHEVGHRWLARLRFLRAGGSPSSELLAADGVHWSFFLDSDASVLGGNEIDDGEDGWFETTDFARRFSSLDQYAMGLRSASEVAPFFYVAEPDNFRPNRPFRPSSSSESGVRFTGVRTELTIEDVIAAMGSRVPEPGANERRLRQAYVLVADGQAPATPVRVEALARIRRRFESWYQTATDGRGTVDTTLRP